jgi:hypothetical protein
MDSEIMQVQRRSIKLKRVDDDNTDMQSEAEDKFRIQN